VKTGRSGGCSIDVSIRKARWLITYIPPIVRVMLTSKDDAIQHAYLHHAGADKRPELPRWCRIGIVYAQVAASASAILHYLELLVHR
jgi:hypothetical protein